MTHRVYNRKVLKASNILSMEDSLLFLRSSNLIFDVSFLFEISSYQTEHRKRVTTYFILSLPWRQALIRQHKQTISVALSLESSVPITISKAEMIERRKILRPSSSFSNIQEKDKFCLRSFLTTNKRLGAKMSKKIWRFRTFDATYKPLALRGPTLYAKIA